MSYNVQITEQQFKEAVKRHEDKWEEELKNVDIKAVALKTKKAVLEQSMRNAAMENHLVSYAQQVTDLERKIAGYERQVDGLKSEVTVLKETFKQAIDLLSKQSETKPRGFFSWIRSLFQ